MVQTFGGDMSASKLYVSSTKFWFDKAWGRLNSNWLRQVKVKDKVKAR